MLGAVRSAVGPGVGVGGIVGGGGSGVGVGRGVLVGFGVSVGVAPGARVGATVAMMVGVTVDGGAELGNGEAGGPAVASGMKPTHWPIGSWSMAASNLSAARGAQPRSVPGAPM